MTIWRFRARIQNINKYNTVQGNTGKVREPRECPECSNRAASETYTKEDYIHKMYQEMRRCGAMEYIYISAQSCHEYAQTSRFTK